METSMDMSRTAEGMGQPASMGRAYIDEYDVVQRYIRRSLSESELAQFEIYMLLNASIVDEIEQQKMLNQLFREELPKANKAFAASHNLLNRFRHIVPLAACLVLALYVGLNTRDRVTQVADTTVLDTLVLQDLRGATNVFNIALPARPAGAAGFQLPLKVDVGPQLESVARYNVFVRTGTDTPSIAQQENLQASADGWLELTVTLPGVSPASYQVEVVEVQRGDSRTYSLFLQ